MTIIHNEAICGWFCLLWPLAIILQSRRDRRQRPSRPGACFAWRHLPFRRDFGGAASVDACGAKMERRGKCTGKHPQILDFPVFLSTLQPILGTNIAGYSWWANVMKSPPGNEEISLKVVRFFPMETGYSMYFPLSLLDYQRLSRGILKKN